VSVTGLCLGAGPLDSEANRTHFDKDQSVEMPGGAGHAAVNRRRPSWARATVRIKAAS